MLHLGHFEVLIIVMAIHISYEVGPDMVGIQEGYNKNFHVDH